MTARPLALTLMLGLTGCGAAADYGRATTEPAALPGVAEIARQSGQATRAWLRPRSAFAQTVDARVAAMREAAPLGMDEAVEIALLRHEPLQRALQGRAMLRPGFVEGLEEVGGDRPADWKLLGLAVAQSRKPRYRPEFGAATAELAEIVFERAAEARRTWVEAVAARQLALRMAASAETAEAAAELTAEQYRSGSASRRDQAERKLAYGHALTASLEADQAAIAAREALVRLLRLHGDEVAWALPDALPEVPTEPVELGDVEVLAVGEGLSALMAREGHAQWAEGLDLRSHARETYAHLRAAWEVARYQEDVAVPAADALLDETQSFYNGMIEDVYALLDAAEERAGAEADRIEAAADYWKAHAEMTEILGGQAPERFATDTTQTALAR